MPFNHSSQSLPKQTTKSSTRDSLRPSSGYIPCGFCSRSAELSFRITQGGSQALGRQIWSLRERPALVDSSPLERFLPFPEHEDRDSGEGRTTLTLEANAFIGAATSIYYGRPRKQRLEQREWATQDSKQVNVGRQNTEGRDLARNIRSLLAYGAGSKCAHRQRDAAKAPVEASELHVLST